MSDQWIKNRGKAPTVKEAPMVRARIRIVSRAEAENRPPQLASYWRDWKLSDSPGCIEEFLIVR